MPTFRERIAKLAFGPEMARLARAEHGQRALMELLQWQPAAMLRMQEVDPAYLDWLMSLQDYENVAWKGYDFESETQRLVKVKESRRLFNNNPVQERCVMTWTDFGFGQNIDIDPLDRGDVDETGTPEEGSGAWYWSEFWNSQDNRPILGERVLHELSNTTLTDGEIYFVFFVSRIDGAVSVRIIPTDEIQEIITEQDDTSVPVYYKRVYNRQGESGQATLYYTDWQVKTAEKPDTILRKAKLPDGARLAEDEAKETEIMVMHVAHRRKRGLRGWPLNASSHDWIAEYQHWLTARAAVAQAVYLYVDKIVTKTGSRGIKAIKSKLQSALAISSTYLETNPVGAPASVYTGNVDIERRPLDTGAGDAERDGGALLAMAALPAGLPPHYLGRGEVVRMAVAEEMREPIRRQWARYQVFWASVWRDMVRLVLWAAEKYDDADFETYDADVGTDALVQTDMAGIARAMDALANMIDRQVLDPDTARKAALEILRITLQQLGVKDTDQIVGDILESLETKDEGEEEQPPEPTTPEAPPEQPEQPEPPVAPEGEETIEMMLSLAAVEALAEAHQVQIVSRHCPLCGFPQAESYEGHRGLLRCIGCKKTYDPSVE